MDQLKPWSSNHPIQRLKNEVDGIFSRVFNDSILPATSLWNDKNSYTPKCNIEEKRDHYMVEVEVPGVDPDDIHIELEENTMTIKGERKREKSIEDKDNKMHVVEQSYGTFYRSFTLPNNVNTDAIDAENKNGILFIKLPKNKESKPRTISIK